MHIIRKVFFGIIGLVLLLALAVVGIIAYDSFFPAQRASDFTNVTYSGPEGITLQGYLAAPEGDGPFPSVLMIHEFYGLNEGIVKKADLLAQEGYVVLAPDAYRGNTTRLIPRAIWLTTTTPDEQIAADLDAAYAYLTQLPQTDVQRSGVVGFCFGGTQALRLGTRTPALAANVIFYGSGLITDPNQLGALGEGGPVLGIFGEEDASIPLEEVDAFDQALSNLGIQYTITVYEDVGHAFVQFETLNQPGPAQEAWAQMINFLEDNLQ